MGANQWGHWGGHQHQGSLVVWTTTSSKYDERLGQLIVSGSHGGPQLVRGCCVCCHCVLTLV